MRDGTVQGPAGNQAVARAAAAGSLLLGIPIGVVGLLALVYVVGIVGLWYGWVRIRWAFVRLRVDDRMTRNDRRRSVAASSLALALTGVLVVALWPGALLGHLLAAVVAVVELGLLVDAARVRASPLQPPAPEEAAALIARASDTGLEMRTRQGSISITWDPDLRMLLVRARGRIGPRLVRWDLEQATCIGAATPEGWWYVVDPTDVTIPSPLNLPQLRRIKGLPNIEGYVVVASRTSLRLLARLVSPLSRPDALVADLGRARAFVLAGGRRRSS